MLHYGISNLSFMYKSIVRLLCSSMASSSTTGRRSISSRVSLNLLCDCGADSVLKTSHTKENPGRKFWGCPYYPVCNSTCSFFTISCDVCGQPLYNMLTDQFWCNIRMKDTVNSLHGMIMLELS